MPVRRPCEDCGRNRAERFFTGPRGRKCSDCRKRTRRAGSHAGHIRRLYNLEAAEFASLLANQGGVCAICEQTRTYTLQVDHDHDPEAPYVRGLLCKRCNKLLAVVADRAPILLAAFRYLQSPPAFDVVGRRRVGSAPVRGDDRYAPQDYEADDF